MQKNEKLTRFSQSMRKNATPQENALWYQYLRNYPIRFRRQCTIGQYIVDFYCAKAKLVIELDGSQHYNPDGMRYDEVRTGCLESLGLKVLRFTNTDINKNLRGVCQQIDKEVQQRFCNGPSPEGVGRRAYTTLRK